MLGAGQTVNTKRVCRDNGVVSANENACSDYVTDEFEVAVGDTCEATYGSEINKSGASLADACTTKFAAGVWDDPKAVDPAKVWNRFHIVVLATGLRSKPMNRFFIDTVADYKAMLATATPPVTTPPAVPPPPAVTPAASGIYNEILEVASRSTSTVPKETLEGLKKIFAEATGSKQLYCANILEAMLEQLKKLAATQPTQEWKDHVVQFALANPVAKDVKAKKPDGSADQTISYGFKIRDARLADQTFHSVEEVRQFMIKETGLFFSFDDPVAKKNLDDLKNLCGSNIIGDPANQDCKDSVNRVLEKIRTATGGDTAKELAIFKEPEKAESVSLAIQITTDSSETPKTTLAEAMGAIIQEYGHAPVARFGVGYVFAPDGGIGGPAKGGAVYDNLNGSLPGHPFIRLQAEFPFQRTPDSTMAVSTELFIARGKPSGQSGAESNATTGTHFIVGVGLKKSWYLTTGLDIYLKGSIQNHFTIGDVLQGLDLGTDDIKVLPGLAGAVGAEYYFSRRWGMFAELSAMMAGYPKSLLSGDDLDEPQVDQQSVWKMYRTSGGVPVVPAFTMGLVF